MPMHNPPHPGEAIREDILPAVGLSLTALAQHLGYSGGQLSTVLHGPGLQTGTGRSGQCQAVSG